MKAGLITFHYAHHYGAQLQAFALMKTIENIGIECEIIDYVRPDTITGNMLFKKKITPKAILSDIHTMMHYPSFKTRYDRFASFVTKYMRLGVEHYSTFGELINKPPKYDVYVCGSDQIWNPLIFTAKNFDLSFFMPFAGNHKKIAYAPSFGVSSIPEDKKEALKGYIKSFSSISVREKQGADIISELIEREVPVVLDPTLLLTDKEWSGICSLPQTKKPYILYYFVSDPLPYFDQIRRVNEALKLPGVCLCGSRRGIPGCASKVFNAGPQEFLRLFKDASFVCTNSFHGTVFSIIFNKNFFCFKNSRNFTDEGSGKKSANSRLDSLLQTLKLQDRMVTGDIKDTALSELTLNQNIDYTYVMKLLGAERVKSLEFLSDALGKKKVQK